MVTEPVTCQPTPAMPCNFYDVNTRTLHVRADQPLKVAAHELCHAHQQQEVLDELGIPVSVDEREWYQTREARDFQALVAEFPPPEWHAIAGENTGLEVFAEACGRYLVQDPAYPSFPPYDRYFESRNFR